jgi:hypothetical protein
MEQSVPKRRHINFRSRGITQKKAYNIVLTALIVIMLLGKTVIYVCYYYKHVLINSATVLSYPAVKVKLTNCLIKHQAKMECEIM